MKTKRYLIFLCMMLVLCCGIFTHLFAVIASAPESPYPANGANGVQLQDLRLQWSQTSVSNNQPYQYSLNMWGSPKTITGYTYKFSASGTHYYLSNGTDTWQNAKTICNNNKWRIGCAHNASINSSMQTNNGGAAAYIGLSDWITEGSFRWENGRALSYTNWAAGEPNDDGGAGDYVEMYPNGTWNDIGTQTRRYWIEVDSWVTHTQTTGNNYFDLNCKLDPNTTYTWSVYTRNNDGQGPTSTWSFTTDADGTAPSSYPAWGSPDSEVANAPLNPTLTWAPVNEATYYKLFVFRSRTDRLGIQHAFINGHVYQKTTTTLNYADAKAAAEANGGHLVTINDAAEQAILPTDFNYWIGLNDVSGQDLSGEGWFVWNVGETNAYTNWDLNFQPPEPNGQTSENYVVQGTSGKWYDIPGTNTYRSLLEYPADVLDGVVVFGTSYHFKDTKLPPNTLYRWTAVPYNAFGRPFGSTQWSFKTNNDGGSAPGTITAATISPANEAPNVPINTVLSWNVPSGSPTEYYAYLGTSNSITNAGNYTDIGVGNGHRYFRSNHGYNWHWAAANAQVQKDGGYLATFGSSTEDAKFNSTDKIWFGGSDRLTANIFKYANGDPWYYTNWHTGEPNNFNGVQYFITKNNGAAYQWDDDYVSALCKYAVEVAPNIADGSRVLTNSYTPSLLRFNTTYYWSAVGSNNVGMANDTQRWSFTTTNGKAVNPSPANSATSIGVNNPAFDWNDIGGASNYLFYLGTADGNWNLVSDASCPTSGYTYNGTLNYGTQYFWKVATVTPLQTVQGDTWNFRTLYSVQIASNPAGATILLDGSTTNQVTPYTFTHNHGFSGTYTVQMTGYGNWDPAQLAISNLSANVSQNFVGQLYQYSVEITSNPAGAAILLNGSTTNQVTPYTFTHNHGFSGTYTVQKTDYNWLRDLNFDDNVVANLQSNIQIKFIGTYHYVDSGTGFEYIATPGVEITGTPTTIGDLTVPLPQYINNVGTIVAMQFSGTENTDLTVVVPVGTWYIIAYYNGDWQHATPYPCTHPETALLQNVPFGGKTEIPVLMTSEDATLPVELSSFTATITSGLFVKIAWVAQSETNHSGYNVLRGEAMNLGSAIKINPTLIDHGVSLGTQISYAYTDVEAYSNMVYYYWLESISLGGVSDFYGPLTITIGDPSLDPLPPVNLMVTKLMNAFPNPFNPNANIRYTLKEAGRVNIDIYNMKGQLVRSFKAEHNTPGYYQVSWDGRDTSGNPSSSGVYLYRMTSGNYSASKKMILAK